jgi:cytochrome P450
LHSLEITRNQGKILQYNLWPISRDPIYAVNDPKIARKIQENPKSLKPRNLYDVFDGLVGGACFICEEGDRYKHPRKSTLVGISHANMESMLANMNLVMDQWITQNLGKEVGDVVDVDIGAESKFVSVIRNTLDYCMQLMMHLNSLIFISFLLLLVTVQKATINSIGKIAFGYDISTDEQEKILSSIIKIVDEFGLACEMNPLRKSPLGYFLYSAKREATRLVKEIRSFAQTMLEAHKSKSIDDQQKIVTMNELTSSGGTNYEQEDLISDMILLFLAGFDTTGYSIGFTLLELAKNQDVQTKLRDELNSASKDPNAGKKRIISSPLLKNVIKETMRLWPVAASGGGRVLSEDMVVITKDIKGLEQTMILPKGSLVVMNTFAMQRDKDTFNRPDEWLPDRWDNATEDMKAAYMPFLVGRRSCPGQLLAISELEVFLSRLLMNYQWSLVKETQPEYSITLKIKGTILQAKKVA